MAIYLVGENIDKHRVNYLVDSGKAIQLMRGIYADIDATIEEVVLQHAVRIAKYLYPNTFLSGVSAIMLTPTADGKLFLSGPRRQRTRIRNLEIIQNDAPSHPSVASAVIDDGMGEFRINVSSIRQRFLEAFRRRSEFSAYIDAQMRSDMSTRLIEEFGSAEAAAEAIWTLGKENGWYQEAEQAEKSLKRDDSNITITNKASLNLLVAWHRQQIGTLSHDGFEWRWKPATEWSLPLVRQTVPGKLPPFISALLPEGWLETILKSEDERSALRNGKRYMSNITIADTAEELQVLPEDILENKLTDYSENGVFTGTYKGPVKDDIESTFEKNLARIFESSETPRLSGVQIKAPMFLNEKGELCTSEEQPFTHILKPAGTNGFEILPVIEYVSLLLAGRCGFEVPDFALVNMAENMPPALIVERFDIRSESADTLMIALEDFCSLLDITAAEKYTGGTIEQAARALRAISTSPDEDLLNLFKRSLFAWLIADGDMHLKNMAVLKTAVPGRNSFSSVRMTPVYDAVSTVVFPGLKNDRMALKLNGKDSRLRMADFVRLAATVGIRASVAKKAVDTLTDALNNAIKNIQLPDSLNYSEQAVNAVQEMLAICGERITALLR